MIIKKEEAVDYSLNFEFQSCREDLNFIACVCTYFVHYFLGKESICEKNWIKLFSPLLFNPSLQLQVAMSYIGTLSNITKSN